MTLLDDVTFLDVLILALVVVATVRGWFAGVARQAFSLGFFVLGLFLGGLLAPSVMRLGDTDRSKALLALITVLGVATVVALIGETLGRRLGAGLRRLQLGWLDSVLGAAFGCFAALVVTWLVAAILVSISIGGIGQAVDDSRIVRALNDRLPPSPPILDRIERFLDPLGFPRVFEGFEPDPGPPVAPPGAAALQSAVDLASPSTLRIQGQGCGGVLTGSGFVAAPELVVTNAHVVAGTRRIVVRDGRRDRPATPVLVDPATDLAVLRVDGLSRTPLDLATDVSRRGAGGAILGYPEGGPLDLSPGAVLQATEARGRDIYDEEPATRAIYVLQAEVRPGNSGGPFVLPDGRVAGIVFARSISEDDIAYALQASELVDDLAEARGATEAVDTGGCAAD